MTNPQMFDTRPLSAPLRCEMKRSPEFRRIPLFSFTQWSTIGAVVVAVSFFVWVSLQ